MSAKISLYMARLNPVNLNEAEGNMARQPVLTC